MRAEGPSKLIREITTAAARHRGGDPASIAPARGGDRWREANMTRDTIDRAIKRRRKLRYGHNYDEVRYRGGGPAGVADRQALTNNRNRTAGEVRSIFSSTAAVSADRAATSCSTGWS